MEEKNLDDEKRKIICQALWDMNISPEEFMGIIEGHIVRKWPDRGFCVARFLESVNWFDVTKVIQPRDICGLWGGGREICQKQINKSGDGFCLQNITPLLCP